MHISAQQVNRDIERMSDNKYNGKQNRTYNSAAEHASHLIEYGSDNAGCKAQGQQTGIG